MEFWKLTVHLIVLEPLAANKKPQLQGKMEGTYDWQPRFLHIPLQHFNLFAVLVFFNVIFWYWYIFNILNLCVFFAFLDFKDDPDFFIYPHLKYVGIELWQVIISIVYPVFLNYNSHP